MNSRQLSSASKITTVLKQDKLLVYFISTSFNFDVRQSFEIYFFIGFDELSILSEKFRWLCDSNFFSSTYLRMFYSKNC